MTAQPPHGPPDPHQGHAHPGPQYPPGPPGGGPPGGPQGQQYPQPPQPPQGAPGAAPQPGYAPPPGGMPPQGPYPPGGAPGQPGPPARPGAGKQRRMIVAGAVGAVVLLVAGIGVTWAVSSAPRVYTAFPDCEEAFPVEMFEDALEREDVELSGEFDPDDGEWGALECQVRADEAEMTIDVMVSVLDPEGEEIEERTEEMADALEELEAGPPPGEVGSHSFDGEQYDEAVWRPGSFGDAGFSFGMVESFSGFDIGTTTSAFLTDNLSVAVYYGFSPDEAELMDGMEAVHDLADGIEGRVSQVGETE